MKKWLIFGGIAAAIVIAMMAISGAKSSGSDTDEIPVAVAQQGGLTIDVLEGGNIQALNFLEFRNEVKLREGVKILEIIDEGYYVTEEDVAKEKVLVRLDESALEEEIVDHDVEFQQTESAYAEAKQNIEIEESEALSEIKGERQVLRFALLDFKKFVGSGAAAQILKKLQLPYDNETLDAYEAEATQLIVDAFDSSKLSETTEDEDRNPYELEADDSLASKVNFGSFLKNEL